MSGKLDLNRKSFVIKSNALIEARYRLSLQESQVILWLLTQIRPDDGDFKPHRLEISEFANLTQVNVGNKYSELRKITKRLMQRVLEVYERKEGRFIQVSWLSSAIYETKKGCVLLRFDPGLKPYLLQLKSHFTKIDIVDTLRLKSVYAIRIFELLVQYHHLGTREIGIDDLREYCGVEKSEYRNYFDLKRKIIEKARIEINAKTEYEVGYKEIKDSRRVASIRWTIQKKTHFEKMQSEKAFILSKELRSMAALLEQMAEYGFSKPTARKLLQNNGEDVVKNALRAVNLQVERGHVKNLKAMLQTAIKEKWHPEVFKKKAS